jgi:hypothetical protein
VRALQRRVQFTQPRASFREHRDIAPINKVTEEDGVR